MKKMRKVNLTNLFSIFHRREGKIIKELAELYGYEYYRVGKRIYRDDLQEPVINLKMTTKMDILKFYMDILLERMENIKQDTDDNCFPDTRLEDYLLFSLEYNYLRNLYIKKYVSK